VRSRSVINFLARVGLVVSVDSQRLSVGVCSVSFSLLIVSCSYIVVDAQLCLLCHYMVDSVGVHFLSLSCCSLFRSGYLVGPPCLLSWLLFYYLFVCRRRCFSEFVLSLSMSYLQLLYVQRWLRSCGVKWGLFRVTRG